MLHHEHLVLYREDRTEKPSREGAPASSFSTPTDTESAAGFLAPPALSLITTNWPEGPRRGRALGWYATAGACGSIGGLVPGVLTELSWRLVFALPVPIAVGALLAGLRLLPADPRGSVREKMDVPGTLTATGALVLLVYALTQAPSHGRLSARTLVLFFAAAALLGLFMRVESRTRRPLVPLSFLTRRTTGGANLTIFAMWGADTSFAFLATLYLQIPPTRPPGSG
ncbi:MFS transporter [Streptomyces massasporeus]|uniref:MFS transporter n=1 Tax=Streptomyces massasporeus TaxID=67324 RepID=UPI0033F04F67